MSITNVNSSVISTAVVSLKQVTIPSDMSESTSMISAAQDASTLQNTGTTTINQPSEEKLNSITTELNNCMKSMNTGIGFSLHKETDTLIVQVEDVKTHEVLKEYPAHEFLDQVARIRDCVGVFLDKRA